MTTTPNALVATVNHERMPVLLTKPEEFDTWMQGTPQEAMSLTREYPAEQMQVVQTGYVKETNSSGGTALRFRGAARA